MTELHTVSGLRGIVFDMDGVLVDTSHCHDLAYQALMKRLGLPIMDYAALAGRSTRSVVAEHLAHLSTKEQKECVEFKQQQALALLSSADIIFSDTVDAIKTLHQQGYRLGLGTSASRNSVTLVLQRLGVSELFDAVVTADDVHRAKPNPEIFNKAITGLGFRASQVLVIEDSLAGLKAAFESGAEVVNVRNEVSTTSFDFPAIRYRGYFPDLGSLVDELTTGDDQHNVSLPISRS